MDCSSCSFNAQICADYQDEIYNFEMACNVDEDGNLTFEVVQPESIAGISGSFGDLYPSVTFDDHVLAFERMADGRVSPVSGPWILMKALRGGYIRGTAEVEDGVKAIMDDSFEENALQLHIWFDSRDIPQSAEIYWESMKVLSLILTDFSMV